jgi:hypothetical protein
MSPFLTGLLLGMTVFSALSMQWAKQELASLQQRNAARDAAQAKELAGAMEFAILTEDAESYAENPTLERARTFSAATTQTRGGNQVLVTTRSSEDTDKKGAFGMGTAQVALTASDDRFTRAAATRTASAEELQRTRTNAEELIFANVRAARERQVITSTRRMEALAEQLYAYYGAELRFPDLNTYTTYAGKLGLRDAWGREFDYDPTTDGQGGSLSFTTPWGFKQALKLSLKD